MSGSVQAAAPATVAGDEEESLLAWVATVCRGTVVEKSKASGGNRRRSFAVDVRTDDGRLLELFLRYDPRRTDPGAEPHTIEREADIYRAIAPIAIRAPRLVAENRALRAILTDRAGGVAELRHLKDPVAKQAIAHEFMDNLAALHAHDASSSTLDGAPGGRIAGRIRRELAIWKAMYEETGRGDPLLDLAFAWLEAHVPDPDDAVVIAHGDAGPGNFLYRDGHVTALIDWEFSHLGDPMDDIAWFSMRCVMEPVPDFLAALRHYETASGRTIDRQRLLYHRVLVSTRVVVIRHRQFAGEPAHAIVSRGLNRRLLVEALADASGLPKPQPQDIDAPETDRTELYDRVIGELGRVVVGLSTNRQVIATAKNAAKVIKYLKAIDQFGPSIELAELAALASLLGERPASVEAGRAALSQGLRAGTIGFADALAYFASETRWGAQLSAEASGSIAHRHYQPLPA